MVRVGVRHEDVQPVFDLPHVRPARLSRQRTLAGADHDHPVAQPQRGVRDAPSLARDYGDTLEAERVAKKVDGLRRVLIADEGVDEWSVVRCWHGRSFASLGAAYVADRE